MRVERAAPRPARTAANRPKATAIPARTAQARSVPGVLPASAALSADTAQYPGEAGATCRTHPGIADRGTHAEQGQRPGQDGKREQRQPGHGEPEDRGAESDDQRLLQE